MHSRKWREDCKLAYSKARGINGKKAYHKQRNRCLVTHVLVRYRVLAQIPPCLLEKMRTNEEKSILTIDHQPFNNKGYCCMASPLIEGCLVDWKNAGFLRNGILSFFLLLMGSDWRLLLGVLQSLIGRRLRENNDFVPSVLENVSTDAAICRFCSENHDVIKSKRRFVIS